MKKQIWISLIIFLVFASAQAQTVDQGAAEYDWQACLNAKADDCINSCSTSEDKDCQDNCNDLAKDKCISEGLQPQ